LKSGQITRIWNIYESAKPDKKTSRWALFLSRFDFVLQHKPGKLSTKPDALSRRADHFKSDADDNKERTLLSSEVFKVNGSKKRSCHSRA
jgi:hypothetical protein